MIDGFKISKLITAQELGRLMAVECLDFCQNLNVSTGEILPDSPIEAVHNGLKIRITSEVNGKGYRLIVRGSLHRFYNDGGTNSNDFYLWQAHQALLNLERLLTIPLKGFKLENLEVGVNIETELTAEKYIKSLIYDGNKAFASLDVNDNYLGKKCVRQDTTLKIYDKGKQEKSNEKRVLRIELKFNRMRLLVDPCGRYRVSEITDLLNAGRMGVFAQELASRWSQIVFYDGGIDETKLSEAQSARLWKYRSPQFWDELNRNQRYKARQSFSKMLAEKSTRNTQKEIEKLILSKCQKLINAKRQKRRRLTAFLTDSEAQKKAMFDTLVYMCQTSPQNPKIETGKKSDKTAPEIRVCEVCGKDISHRKKTARTCSRKCRNVKSNRNRTQRHVQRRNDELKQLQKIVDCVKTENVKISLLKVKRKRAVTIYTSDIKPMKYKERRKVTKVRGTCAAGAFEFTGMRAKEFIKCCILNNYRNEKNKAVTRKTQAVCSDAW